MKNGLKKRLEVIRLHLLYSIPELEKEKWDIDMKKVKREAEEALKKYTEVLEQLENEVWRFGK